MIPSPPYVRYYDCNLIQQIIMAHLCPTARGTWSIGRNTNLQRQAVIHQHVVQCRATIELPLDLEAELDELEQSKYCGGEGKHRNNSADNISTSCFLHFSVPIGHVLVREAPANVPKNGKKYHIHTFGCQVRTWPIAELALLRAYSSAIMWLHNSSRHIVACMPLWAPAAALLQCCSSSPYQVGAPGCHTSLA